ncbi:CRISPR-associated endonuclease Cas1 [Halonatronum saccharophilum]|uniref:CRISPR-associated endonuclease Cas1 n=1 Tax=Halonatronum saccharophilum TaxID=150060 RepID=UPI000489D34D|nr:CRISPR-associated endonuclease Cas1 [Halonatronum saccharophilum]
MERIYITKRGTKISKRGKRIIVKEEGKKIADIPLINVDQVVALGSVGITGATIQLLLKEGIPITYLSYYGRFKGRLVPEYSKNSIFRLRQFSAYNDEKVSLRLTKAFVRGKLKNMRTVLMRDKNGKGEAGIKEGCSRIKGFIKSLDEVDDIEKIRGYEGIGAKVYFENFKYLLKDGFEFAGRNRRPPKDPVNSLLSFGYSLLLNDVITALYLSSFDPYIGFFHSIKHGRPSLALDLMEEFRQPVVDRLVKALLNKGMLTLEDFRIKEEGVLLTEEGRKLFLTEYEKKLESLIAHPSYQESISWRRCIEEQSRLLRKSIEKGEDYIAMGVR